MTAFAGEQEQVARLDWWSNLLMVLIVAAPFAISASSLTNLARANGVSWAWLYPVMVDGGLAIFKILSLRSSLQGERDWFNLGMAGLMTLLSVALNVLHVAPEKVADVQLARFMAGLPPVIILFAFIAISRRIEQSARKEVIGRTLQELETGVEEKRAQRDALDQTIDTLAADKARLTDEIEAQRVELKRLAQAANRQAGQLSDRRPTDGAKSDGGGRTVPSDKLAELLAFVATHPNATRIEIGEAIGRSRSTVSDYLKQLREAGKLSKNGHGWEVAA